MILREKQVTQNALRNAQTPQQRRDILNSFKQNVNSIRRGDTISELPFTPITTKDNQIVKALENAKLRPQERKFLEKKLLQIKERKTELRGKADKTASERRELNRLSLSTPLIETAFTGQVVGVGSYNLLKDKTGRKKLIDGLEKGLNPSKLPGYLRDKPNIINDVRRAKASYVNFVTKTGNFVVANPEEAVFYVGGEIIVGYLGGKSLSLLGKYSKALIPKLVRKGNSLYDSVGKIEGIRVKAKLNTNDITRKAISDYNKKKLIGEALNKRIDIYVKQSVNKLERLSGTKFGEFTKLDIEGKIRTRVIKEFKKRGIKVDEFLPKPKKGLLQKVSGKIKTAKENVKNKKVQKKLDKEYSVMLKKAKAIRMKGLQKGKRLSLNNPEYDLAIRYLKDTTERIANIKALTIIKNNASKGIFLNKTELREFLSEARKISLRWLESQPEYKTLKNLASKSQSDTIKLLRVRKIKSARYYFKVLIEKFERYFAKFKSYNKIKKIASKVKTTTRKTIRKVKNKITKKIKNVKNKRREKRVLKRARLLRKKGRKRIIRKKALIQKQTIIRSTDDLYKNIKFGVINKAKPKVSIERLQRNMNISNMNKFIEDYFLEIKTSYNKKISDLKYNQLKNIIKKRMKKAIISKDKKTINNFFNEVKKVKREMQLKSSKPDITIESVKLEPIVFKGKSVTPKRVIKTIKNFESFETPTQYKQITKGNQILLQKVKTKSVVKQVTKFKNNKLKFKVKSINKKRISLKPLVRFASNTLLASLTSIPRVKSKSNSQVFTQLQNQSQDFKIIQDIAQDTGQSIVPLLRTRLRQLQKQPTITVTKNPPRTPTKKKPIIPRFTTPKNTKTLKKEVLSYYVVTKRRGKLVKLLPSKLTLQDAKDYLAYNLDNTLSRTAYYVPAGNTKKVLQLPKSVQGYLKNNQKKLRPYSIKRGKKKELLRGLIEKRKYFTDTRGERTQLKRNKRKLTSQQKKTMLRNLKKARAKRKSNSKK